ncbi:glycosyltransferase [Gemmatimonadota bacterium]
MHVCIFANSESIHTVKLVRYLMQQGNRVDVISFEDGTIEGAGMHFLKTPFRRSRFRYVFTILQARRIVRGLKPDLVVAIYLTGYGFLGAMCNTHPFVVMALGSDVLITPDQSPSYRTITAITLKRADGIISVADHITERLLNLGVDPEVVLTNPIGVDTDIFRQPEPGNPKEGGLIVSTRTLEPQYNVEQLIECLPVLTGLKPDARIIIIGGGTQYDTFLERIRDMPAALPVNMLGWVALPVLVDVLQRGQVFVSLSTTDGAPVSLFEAMACGCFPVVTDIPANRFWIEDGKNGFLIPVGESKRLAERISEALDSEDLMLRAQSLNRELIREKLELSRTMHVLNRYLQDVSTAC